MPLPEPIPGLVISYDYLWTGEAKKGREEGTKARPCAIVLARQNAFDKQVVTVVPITHTQPDKDTPAIELPPALKAHLGLDDFPSWVIVSEVNDFVWPGPDMRPVPKRDPVEFSYGVVPPGFFRKIRERLLEAVTEGKVARVKRSQ